MEKGGWQIRSSRELLHVSLRPATNQENCALESTCEVLIAPTEDVSPSPARLLARCMKIMQPENRGQE